MMHFEEAKQHIKTSPDMVGMRHPGMSAGWLVFWKASTKEPEGGFTYHLNPIMHSEVCFPISNDECARGDWTIKTRPKTKVRA